MKFNFETTRGMRGTTKADTHAQALQILEAQYGQGSIALIDGKQPAAGAPATPAAAGSDPHNWAKAFELAASRA